MGVSMTLIYCEEGHCPLATLGIQSLGPSSPSTGTRPMRLHGTAVALGPGSSPCSCTLKALLWLLLVLFAESMVGVYREG